MVHPRRSFVFLSLWGLILDICKDITFLYISAVDKILNTKIQVTLLVFTYILGRRDLHCVEGGGGHSLLEGPILGLGGLSSPRLYVKRDRG